MTIITSRGNFVAADRGLFQADLYVGVVRKLVVLPDRSIIGGSAGDQADCEAFREWVLQGAYAEPPEASPSFEGLLLSHRFGLEWIGSKRRLRLTDIEFFAVGAGFQVATGAMRAGASAKVAAEIACDQHAFCRGPVDAEELSIPGR
jgi:hypothetical protein